MVVHTFWKPSGSAFSNSFIGTTSLNVSSLNPEFAIELIIELNDLLYSWIAIYSVGFFGSLTLASKYSVSK